MYNNSVFTVCNQGCHQNKHSEYSGRSRGHCSSYVTHWKKPASLTSPDSHLVNRSFTAYKEVSGIRNIQNIYGVDDERIGLFGFYCLGLGEEWSSTKATSCRESLYVLVTS